MIAYFLHNKGELFAVTASIYLFWRYPPPAFIDEKYRQSHAGYTQYLKKLFAVDLIGVQPPP